MTQRKNKICDCPFCGSSDVILCADDKLSTHGAYYIACCDCDAEGPRKDDIVKAGAAFMTKASKKR